MQNNKHKNKVHIIGGQWRGRPIIFDDEQGVRPTQGRIRETLFNWLMPFIRGAKCLDLFAGSGALGLEALSRGAEYIVFVDQSRQALNHIQHFASRVGTNKIECVSAQFPNLKICNGPFDIIFVDPPFSDNILTKVCHWLVEKSLIKQHGLVYIEAPQDFVFSSLPTQWQVYRHKKTRSLHYALFQLKSTS